MSDAETIFEFAEEFVHAKTKGYFNELQRTILLNTLQGNRKTYDEIAEECGYSAKYIKQNVAPKLWNLLSEIFNEKIAKSNVRPILEREFRNQSLTSPESTVTTPLVEPSLPINTEKPPVDYSFPLDKGTILLVDDQLKNLRLLSDLLEEEGYEVLQALNGSLALQSVSLEPPDLILLDINMPGLDGYGVCQQLKQNSQTKDIPVIFVSALDEVWDKVKAFSVGGVDYIPKPFKVIEVLARIENQLKIRRLQQDLKVQNAQFGQAIQELQRLGVIDRLTQVANRPRFEQYLSEQWLQAIETQTPLTLIFYRLDNFDNYENNNDNQASKRLLIQVAKVISQRVQGTDTLVGRYEEAKLGIILVNLEASEGKKIAETILKEIESLKITSTSSSVSSSVQVSIGIATSIPQPEDKVDTLIEECDRSLGSG